MAGGHTRPDIVMVGVGVGSGLQLTLEAQRLLDRVGKAYALALPAPLARHLRSLRIKVVDLRERFADLRPLRDVYVDVANFLFDRAAVERPVVVLTPGSPLFLNSIGRLLVLEGRRAGMTLQTLAGVSPLDALISYLGLDVANFGLQVFTADHLVRTRRRVDATVPLVVLELAAAGVRNAGTRPLDEPSRYGELAFALARTYPLDHPTTLVNVTDVTGRRSHATVPLKRFGEFLPKIGESSHLFVDGVRRTRRDRHAPQEARAKEP